MASKIEVFGVVFFLAKGPITERQEADDGRRTDTRRNREGNLAVSV